MISPTAGAGGAAERTPVVWISHKPEDRCTACGKELGKGNFVEVKTPGAVRCMACAGFIGVEFLPSGDPALTRRALKLSPRHAVVVKFSRARGRAERQGVLVEPAAVEEARRGGRSWRRAAPCA